MWLQVTTQNDLIKKGGGYYKDMGNSQGTEGRIELELESTRRNKYKFISILFSLLFLLLCPTCFLLVILLLLHPFGIIHPPWQPVLQIRVPTTREMLVHICWFPLWDVVPRSWHYFNSPAVQWVKDGPYLHSRGKLRLASVNQWLPFPWPVIGSGKDTGLSSCS